MRRAAEVSDLWARGRHAEALALANDALSSSDDDEHRDVAGELAAAALAALDSPDPHVAQALELLVSFAEAMDGPVDEKTWRALAMLSRYHERHGQLELATRAATRALDVARRSGKGRGGLVSQTLALLGDLRMVEGNVVEAERALREGLAILDRTGRGTSEAAAGFLVKLITMLERRGSLAEAEELQKRLVGVAPAREQPHRALERVSRLARLAELQAAQSKTREALETGGRAFSIVRKQLDRDSADTAEMARRLGELYASLKRPQEAVLALELAHEVLRRTRGATDPAVVAVSGQLAAARAANKSQP